MPNTRAFCDQVGNDHALVLPKVELRDNLGSLAVQILAAREDLSTLPYDKMLQELFVIIQELHKEYQRFNPA